MKKVYLLPFCLLSTFTYAEENNNELFLVDEVIANVGVESIFLSDLQTTISQLQYQKEDFKEDQVIKKLIQNAALVSKAKDGATLSDSKTIESKINDQMDDILAKFYNDKKLIEKYLGKKVYALRKDIEKNFKDQYFISKLQRGWSEDMRCTHRDVVKFYKRLEKENKVPSVDESFEAYELVVLAEEDPKILNTLLEIRKKIDEGEDFIKLVKEYSQDEDTVEKGGELGWFKIGELKDEYEKAALALKPGETSKIVKTNIGYHIIQLIDAKEGEFNSRHIFIFSSINDDMSSLFDKIQDIKNKILNHELTWNEAVKKYSNEGTRKFNFGLITTGFNNFSTREHISEDDFDIIKNLKEGEISEPVSCFVDDRKAVRIIYLRKKKAEHTLNLRDDYEQICDMTKNYKMKMIFTKNIDKITDGLDIKVDNEIIKISNF